MNVHHLGEIRRITLGRDHKEAMSFAVGQNLSTPTHKLKITEIIFDADAFQISGASKYVIYVLVDDEKESVPFKSYENMPVTVEYNIK